MEEINNETVKKIKKEFNENQLHLLLSKDSHQYHEGYLECLKNDDYDGFCNLYWELAIWTDLAELEKKQKAVKIKQVGNTTLKCFDCGTEGSVNVTMKQK